MISPGRLVIEPLGRHHDRAAFSCGNPSLDLYLRRQAGQDVRRRVARVFVTRGDDPSRILGFYTLSALSIEGAGLPAASARKLPGHPLPAALIGRLAVDLSHQGRRIGSCLLVDALQRTLAASETTAVFAMVVDTIDDSAKSFYESFGFVAFLDRPMRLFLPLASTEKR
jgi:GNAT superfamily N-acetyltransferase